ncbi:putative serine threonine-protein kinase dyrk2 isoform x1 [Neofusicoccum parvum]|nr:putative serine threonine-protein kinase dyrk2 isoform x1 [Neofusicoccum parvum]
MKRKFSLNLAPIKVPTKQETRALKESLATRDISTPSSPYVNRRILAPRLEAELRSACEAVLNEDGNSYGAAAALQAEESKMDFQALQRSMRAMEQQQKQQSSHRRTGSHPPPNPLPRRDRPPTEHTARLPANAFSYKPDAALRDLFPEQGAHPVQANTSRRREGHGAAYDTKSSRNVSGRHREQPQDHSTARYANYDRPSTAPIGRGVDSPDTNYSTPMSASTMENHRNYASTAMTSADPSRTSKLDRRHRRPEDVSRKPSTQHQARPGPRTEDSIARDLAQSHELMSMSYGASDEAINRSDPSLVDSGHSPDDSYQGRKPSMKISVDHFRGETPNFSKKISTEKMLQNTHDHRYKYKAEIKANNTLATGSQANVKGLKKMFSHLGLGGRREKKETWMDKFEKDGVKGGILIHDEAAGAPIVRY